MGRETEMLRERLASDLSDALSHMAWPHPSLSSGCGVG
jgi:hypothetical protein